MMRSADRRTILRAAGTAAVAAITGAGFAQSAEIRGTVEFEGGKVIPKGEIKIYIDDPAVQDGAQRPAATMRLESGGAKAMDFSLSPLASAAVSPRTQIVARLERADGWLLARGSAGLEIGSPITITLYPVMY